MLFSRDCIILLVALYFWFYLKHVHSEEEIDYTLKLKGWETVKENNPYITVKDVKMKKYNKTHYVMDGAIEVLRDDILAEELLITILGAYQKGNGFQQSPLIQRENQNFCDMILNDKMIMEDIILSTNYSTSDPCPPPKGIYYVTNYIPKPEKLPKRVPPSLWRFTLLNLIGETVMSGINVYVEVQLREPGE